MGKPIGSTKSAAKSSAAGRNFRKLNKHGGSVEWNQATATGVEWMTILARHMEPKARIQAFLRLKGLIAVLTKYQQYWLNTELDDANEVLARKSSSDALESAYLALQRYYYSLQGLTPAEIHVFRIAVGVAYGFDACLKFVPPMEELTQTPDFKKYNSVRSMAGLEKGRPGFPGSYETAELLVGFWEKFSQSPADYKKGDGHILQFVSDAVELHMRSLPGRESVPLLTTRDSAGAVVETLRISAAKDALLQAVMEVIKRHRKLGSSRPPDMT